MPFIPHTPNDVHDMLIEIGISQIDELFHEIPPTLLSEELSEVPEGISEAAMIRLLSDRAERNMVGVCFAGGGSYDHHIPAAVWDLTARGEFYTAYTPYQAEASQGGLQLVYEFQTMMASLNGMDVANASVYDGATALAESILMAVRANHRSKSRNVLVCGVVNPFYLETVQTLVANQDINILRLETKQGMFDPDQSLPGEAIAVVVQQPNFFGLLESTDSIVDWAHGIGALVVAVVNPTTLAVLKPPGEWGNNGADIACGDGQPLGIPMSYGGPAFGFLCTKMSLVRQMPGRIVGKTVDLDGNTGYTLTLQAREQHIRRSKATSNICTNQGLLVTAATVYLSIMGRTGMRNVALASHSNTKLLVSRLMDLDDVHRRFPGSFFHECVIDFDRSGDYVVQEQLERGILAGVPLGGLFDDMDNSLLVCATEQRTEADIELYCEALENG